jgi:hypothetical protein
MPSEDGVYAERRGANAGEEEVILAGTVVEVVVVDFSGE